MISNFNTQALANSLSGNVPSGQTERADVEKVFKKLDRVAPAPPAPPDADGQQAAVVKISAEGARRADVAPQSAPAPDAGAAESPAAAGSRPPAAGPSAKPQTSASAKPGGGPAASGQAEDAPQIPTTGAIASSTQTFEPADANEDGSVTASEQQEYDARVAANKAAEQAASTARSAEASAAVKAYASVGQLREDGGPAAS